MLRVVVSALLPLLCVLAPAELHAAGLLAPTIALAGTPTSTPSGTPTSTPTNTPTNTPTDSAEFTEQEAVQHALKWNPSLRAFRKQRAVAEGLIVTATALTNPTVQLQLVHFQEAAEMGWTVTLKWTPPQPVEWLAKRSQSHAYLEQVGHEIAEQEWSLAAQVRTLHGALVELREQAKLLDEALQLRRRMGTLMQARVQRGAATRLEQNLAQLALLSAQRERHEVELRRTQTQSQLHALLGIMSAVPLTVRGEPVAEPQGVARLDAAALAEQAVLNRPLRKAAHARITQREQALRAEKSRRIPWPELGGRYGQTGSTKYPNDWQVGVQLPLPILNWNNGPVQVARAELLQEQAAEQAQLDALRQSVYAACAELQLRSDILQQYRREILPILTEHERLMQIAVQGGQLDLVALLSSEDSVLRGRRDYSAARLAYRQAWLTLQAAVGTPLPEVAS